MQHIYKSGGIRKTKNGTEYTIKAVSEGAMTTHIKAGWVSNIEELEAKKPIEVLEKKEEIKTEGGLKKASKNK
jgi:hypothetical protein